MEDDIQSVSTVSGSGIDFFRKFVQRKTSAESGSVESCRDCQDQFRREVLIDRLVSDSLNTRAHHAAETLNSRTHHAAESFNSAANHAPQSLDSNSHHAAKSLNNRSQFVINNKGSDDHTDLLRDSSSNPLHGSSLSSSLGSQGSSNGHRCDKHRDSVCQEDSQSVSTRSSSVSMVSSVSGSGLLFLKNYLKKKKKSMSRGTASTTSTKDLSNISFFNSTPLPFPPPSDYYGPAFVPGGQPDSRRMSLCSTVADLLNEDFDCDDSELKNLDWEEWDEPLPEELSYDDLVSVISESFYSEELDLSELCDLDLEGRNTVVATEKEMEDREGPDSLEDGGDLSTTPSTQEPEPTRSKEPTSMERVGSSKSKFGRYKSREFLQDLEAELELPPMTPVSDEKEEAVRAISRTISKYIRTKSDSSYDGKSSRLTNYSRTKSNTSYDGEESRSQYRSHNLSRQDEYGRVSRNSGYDVGYARRRAYEDHGRESRLSVVSPAMSDYLPELSTEPSPALSRRPLSQLLVYDVPSSPLARGTPDDNLLQAPVRGVSHNRSPATALTQQQISEILTLPKNDFSLNLDGRSTDLQSTETRLRNTENQVKNANRDSLLCGAQNFSPTSSPPPAMRTSSPPPPPSRPSFYRHSSTNSSDSGCPLFEDKIPSLSPTPSPRTNIELLSSNRTKLVNFWERSLGASSQPESSNWLPASSQRSTSRQGFQPPVKTGSFGSETNLVNSQDRLAHFLDVTRRAAECRRNGRGYFHRASTGSDCSDFFERIPASPALSRRRDSFTEYFV